MNASNFRNASFNAAPSQQGGIGLIEVMIAVLVFAIGGLGLMAMQVTAKRTLYEATQRSIATGLARDVIERMRSNRGQIGAYVVNEIGDEASPLATPGTNCGSASCTPAQLATFDLADWETLLMGGAEQSGGKNAGGLVSPRACITVNGRNVTVAIAWLGVSSSTNPGESNCGQGIAGLYDDPDEAAGNNLRRRVMVMTTYIGST